MKFEGSIFTKVHVKCDVTRTGRIILSPSLEIQKKPPKKPRPDPIPSITFECYKGWDTEYSNLLFSFSIPLKEMKKFMEAYSMIQNKQLPENLLEQ